MCSRPMPKILDFIKRTGFCAGRLQGPQAYTARLGPSASPTHPARRRRVIVSVSPQEGFLHQYSELDTLGADRPESKCRLK